MEGDDPIPGLLQQVSVRGPWLALCHGANPAVAFSLWTTKSEKTIESLDAPIFSSPGEDRVGMPGSPELLALSIT